MSNQEHDPIIPAEGAVSLLSKDLAEKQREFQDLGVRYQEALREIDLLRHRCDHLKERCDRQSERELNRLNEDRKIFTAAALAPPVDAIARADKALGLLGLLEPLEPKG
jgi:hypothetical protein